MFRPLRLIEIALVLVRLNDIASRIVNANHGIMRPAAMLRVADCIRDSHTTTDQTAAHRTLDRRRVCLCARGNQRPMFFEHNDGR